MKPHLSIILPSIRSERLVGLYESILKSTSRSFELIICGPYPLPQELQEIRNIKYVKDFGSPVRASNIAATLCEGEVCTWLADDCLLFEGALDKCLDEFHSMNHSPTNVLVAKYFEGQEGSEDRNRVHPDSYFKIIGSPAASPFLPPDWWLFNIGFMYTKFFLEMGGWDSSYEGTWAAHTDLAIRAQSCSAKVKMAQIPLLECDHMPGGTGDHMPIFICQPQHDEPLLHKKYRIPNWNTKKVLLDDWKDAPAVWGRRFGDE